MVTGDYSSCNNYSEFRSKLQELLADEGDKQCNQLVNADKLETLED